jgi:hypothetical protein
MDLRRWREVGKRLRHMSRAELRDRLRQEFGKRQDALLAQLGYNFVRAGQAGAQQGRSFFFTSDSTDLVLAQIRLRLPKKAEEIVDQANQIRKHRFDLLGYTALDYGSTIDWHLDAVHGKRAPRKMFYNVRYLDYEEVGDSKVTWELNRHQHLVTLAKAYRLTGDRAYADEVLQQWRHWWAENPYPVGINWASSLEAAFRSLSWIWTYHLLYACPGLPDYRQECLRGLALHGRHIERYLSTFFSPNTHLLGEGVALFFLGVLFPGFRAADRWRLLGWGIVLREAERQVRADGFHLEQSTYYHVYALDFFLHAAVLASLNQIALPDFFEDTLEKMLTALCLMGRGGQPPRFGDDDGGRLFDPRRNRGEHLLDPLATGAVLFARGDYKSAAGGLREETLWLLGNESVQRWDELEETSQSVESAALTEVGFYMLTANNSQAIVDTGSLGVHSGGHGHADALSFCLQSQGHSLLIDPGTYAYVGPGPDRDMFRGTGMHNTVRVDGADQAETATPFSWRRFNQCKVERWIRGRSLDVLVASHDGYQRLDEPVTHRRWVVSLKNGVYLVRDEIEGQGRHQLEIAWHLGQELQLVQKGLFRVKSGTQGLALIPAQGEGWAEQGSQECWSPAYGQKAPMAVMKFSAEAALPAEFAFVLAALEEVHPGSRKLTRITNSASSAIAGYKYVADGSEHFFFFAEEGKSWLMNSLSSDAEIVYWKRTPGAEQLIFCGGSYALVEGGIELRCLRRVQWAELILEGESRAVFVSDLDAIGRRSSVAQQPDTIFRHSE